MTQNAQFMKERTDQLNLIKIKNSAKDTVKRMRRQAQIGIKYLQKTSDKGLFSKTCKELLKLNNKKINNTI